MRLMSYQTVLGPDETARCSRAEVGSAAWVEPDGTLVDVASAYRWFCENRNGAAYQAETARHLSSIDGILKAGLLADGGIWLDHLRKSWLTGRENREETAKACIRSATNVRISIPFHPRSFRDFYAFEEHVKTCRMRRGQPMVEEWYQFPVFYFSNSDAFLGPDDPVWAPKGCQELDFELEVACVVGKSVSNGLAPQADEFIAGYVVLNDWSARDLQRAEVKVGLGPAKGKDFATSFGPYLVTASELVDCAERSPNGVRYSLTMSARVNGKLVSTGNFRDIHYTFAQMIERASCDVTLFPGDVLGSGTVGSGCVLELGPAVQPWLRPGDVVELEIERLGCLRSQVVERPITIGGADDGHLHSTW